MSKSVMYTEVFIEYAEDGFRWSFSECDGIFHIEYQEYVDKEGNLETNFGKGEWKTKDKFEGLWVSDVEKICAALKRVTETSEYK